MEPPRVTVLLASRDGERYLSGALASLAAQTYGSVEIVAVDDGSRDRTGELLAAFAAERPGVRVLRGAGEGLAAALDRAARAAQGAYLARHDDDDLSHPERLARQVAYLDAHPDVAALGTASEWIDADGRSLGALPVPLDGRAIARALRRGPPFVHGSVMMRAAAYRAAGGYRAAFGAAQDYDLWLRMRPHGRFANLAETLYRWRMHPRGVFARARADQLRFTALARAFDAERREEGSDSIEAFARAGSVDRFLDTWARAPELALRLGEGFAREGRTGEARRYLARALRGTTLAPALGWWLASLGVALTPRARRAGERAT